MIILVINLALGAKPKDTLKWLKDRNIISESQYDERSVYDVIRHWKMTSGEVFLKHHKVHEGIQPFKCNISDSSFVQNGSLADHDFGRLIDFILKKCEQLL